MNIRFVNENDAKQLLKIYSQYINTPITFEYTLPTEEEFTQRIKDITSIYPYIVVEDDKKIIGYAYAHKMWEREAYKWNSELSIYIDKNYTSQGLGKKLYTTLIELLKLQGVKTLYGVVTLPNEKSEKLHKSLGFEKIAIHENAGYKCNKWHDIIWFRKVIGEHKENPEKVLSINDVNKEKINKILAKF